MIRRIGYLLVATIVAVFATVMVCWGEDKPVLTNDLLQLSVEYPDQSFKQIRLVLTNNSDEAVRVLTGAYPLEGDYIQVYSSNGEQLVLPKAMPVLPPPTEKDYLTIAPHTTVKLNATVSNYYQPLKPGTLYFLAIEYPTDKPGLKFSGHVPYGIPTQNVK